MTVPITTAPIEQMIEEQIPPLAICNMIDARRPDRPR
jgi:hypothetical protein